MTKEQYLLEPALYLVPTPIGNREDITLRALRVLASADILAAEDTRALKQLLAMYKLPVRTIVSYHEHNERQKSKELIAKIVGGNSVAYCSEAGMPLVSDPGYRLVEEAIAQGVRIVPLPGASAALTALVASGLAVHAFTFLGFPPHKKGRRTFLARAANREETVILYESPHRIERLIAELRQLCGDDRRCVLARELTKVHESFYRGTLGEIAQQLGSTIPVRGEFVVLLQGQSTLAEECSSRSKE
ncbi:MAG: 16S rRNA (cytidine(1402)-2'-O)-methyltransferase [Bacteroidota bacterium]|nr:16S rRNA (cytidine(1402)-2'-O)-methyltransferase [Candidatus Kapabacteria bacterium]MCX7936109.1 16S rRNA (cytidine(1402)-2'-O)-methyltransferase [Chlorobiota bacterium]MDW8074997.1 16S rRNA (cytidine(1402)-2'-O)-methyltransferase [Bacteroidota bacterium]MDW8271636.1 16S rRNA (cytidine(1402)-2'-O)-methyltransferase [Bacteroidota bacterium]